MADADDCITMAGDFIEHRRHVLAANGFTPPHIWRKGIIRS
jgi:hypothetical protein